MNKLKFLLWIFLIVLIGLSHAKSQPKELEDYNIIWTEQSINSSESMPLVGGDMACNVWVEKGDILFYLQRSGSLISVL